MTENPQSLKNFRTVTLANETAFSEISGKEDNLTSRGILQSDKLIWLPKFPKFLLEFFFCMLEI